MSRGIDAGTDYKIRLLRSSPIFAGAAEEDLAELARVGRSVATQRGAMLPPDKRDGAQIFVVQSGICAELAFADGARAGILAGLHGPGAVAGLSEALAPDAAARGSRRRFEALSNLSVLALPAADLLRVCRRAPDLAAALWRTLAIENDRLARAYAHSLQHSLEMRLAAFFAEIAELTMSDDWNPEINVGRLSQAAIAEMLGVSREHVNRTLAVWERSGLIFQNKKGDVFLQNKKRLASLATTRSEAADGERQNERLWEIDAHLDRGLNHTALHLALEALKRAPKDLLFAHRAVLATARLGAISEALALLEKQKLGRDPADEELACLRPRLMRDLAFSRDSAAPDKALLAASAAQYEAVFEASRGYYSGVNAAEGCALTGDSAKAKNIAAAVSAALAADLEEDDRYWWRSTLAECRLLEGDKSAAALLFASACNAEDAAPGKKATTRKQLKRLGASVGIEQAWIDRVAPQPGVMYFCGPMAWGRDDDDGVPVAELCEALRAFLKRSPVGWAYGALASGADATIAQTLLDAGASLNIYLPLPPREFVQESVHGAGWRERIIACMQAASSVDWNRRAHPCNAVYLLGAEIGMGKALRQAAQLESEAVGFFATQKGRTARDSHSIANLELWKARGFKHVEVSAAWPARPTGQRLDEPQGDALYFALLLQGGEGSASLSRPPEADAHLHDAPSGLDIFLFAALEGAVVAAAALGMRADAASRSCWLDAGVFPSKAAKAGPLEAAQHFITGANRPLTEPGKVFASDVFASVAALNPALPASFEYVGFVPTREKLDPCAMYLVRF